MMPLEAMYARDVNPCVFDTATLSAWVWPPAPKIPMIGPLRAGQLDDELHRIDTIEVTRDQDDPFRQMLERYADIHGRIHVGMIFTSYVKSTIGVWI